jgi:hypothetical protein
MIHNYRMTEMCRTIYGDQVYGFAAGLSPTGAPTLPDPDPGPDRGTAAPR